MLRALDIARGAGLDPVRLAEAAARQVRHVVDGAAGTAARMRELSYPSGAATLVEHLPLVDKLVEQRAEVPLGTGGLGAVARLLRGAVAAGRGDDGLTVVTDERIRPAAARRHPGRPATLPSSGR